MLRSWKMIALTLVATLALLVVAGIGVWVYVVQNVEQPSYAVAATDGAIEVRTYPPLVVAEVTVSGDRKTAVGRGFRPLARYIFAQERGGDSIAMTAPVTQTTAPETNKPAGRDDAIAMTAPVTQTPADSGKTSSADQWTVRFIMPSQYALEDLPEPGNEAVKLTRQPGRTMAAIRFSGVADDASIAKQEAKLRAWLEANNRAPTGPATYAYYNDPFTPGFLRRNEVMIPIADAANGDANAI